MEGGGRAFLSQGHLCSLLWGPLDCVWRVSHTPIYQERNQLMPSVRLLLNIWNCSYEKIPVACQLKHLPWLRLPPFISPASHSLLLPREHQPLPSFDLAPKKVSLAIALLIHSLPIKNSQKRNGRQWYCRYMGKTVGPHSPG